MKENTPKDVLDTIKEAEKKTKARVLLKSLTEIKGMTRSILELKEKTIIMLEEIGMSEEDIKRVIDFVNSVVILSESDKKDIRDNIKKELSKVKERADEKVIEGFVRALDYYGYDQSIVSSLNTPTNVTVPIGSVWVGNTLELEDGNSILLKL